MTLRIVPGDFSDPRVVEMIRFHHTTARAATEEKSAHALDLSGLQDPKLRFWTIWDDDSLVGMGAIKELSSTHGEVKSMHTSPNERRKGVATAMLLHLIEQARAQKFERLSLETGSGDFFKAALALYKAHGFVECAPFGDYTLDPNSVFLTLTLSR